LGEGRDRSRHCERSEAIQPLRTLDCFVRFAPRK
jgi:hypothetical protein